MPRPIQPGLTQNELEIMKILWKQAPLTVSNILTLICRKTEPAYTSILTLMQIMERKGYVKHHKNGKAFSYYPVLRREKFLLSEIKRITKNIFEGTPGDLVLNLVENEHLTPEEIKSLKQLLKD